MKKSKKFWIFLVILMVINVVIYLTHLGGEKVLLYVSDTLPVLCSLICAVFIFMTVKRFSKWDYTKVSWLMIFAGIVLYFIAESVYAVLELYYGVDMNTVFPTAADYFWCAGYIPVFAGLIMMLSGYMRSGFPMGHIKLYTIIAPLILILFSVIFYFLLIPIFRDTESSDLARFFYLFYPVGDLFIVMPAVLLIYITWLFGKGTISKPWKYLAFGFMFFTVADLLYSYLDWQGKYGGGNLIDLGWNAGYLLIALGGIYQIELLESFNTMEK